jgi:hypothetical protein
MCSWIAGCVIGTVLEVVAWCYILKIEGGGGVSPSLFRMGGVTLKLVIFIEVCYAHD